MFGIRNSPSFIAHSKQQINACSYYTAFQPNSRIIINSNKNSFHARALIKPAYFVYFSSTFTHRNHTCIVCPIGTYLHIHKNLRNIVMYRTGTDISLCVRYYIANKHTYTHKTVVHKTTRMVLLFRL